MSDRYSISEYGRLVEVVRSAVSLRIGPKGETLTRKVRGSSINLPDIDEDKTRKNAEALVRSVLTRERQENALAQLKAAVSEAKSLFTSTHDGFRMAKGAGKGKKMTVSDLYAFSIAAGFCFDFLGPTQERKRAKVAIGVMAPAVQDCGKNLIKLMWKASGYRVADLGASVQPAAWLEEISSHRISVVAVSCMTNKCIGNLERLVKAIANDWPDLPVIIGGIAVNRITAYDLAQRYHIRVHFGQDINDAESVLEKALSRAHWRFRPSSRWRKSNYRLSPKQR